MSHAHLRSLPAVPVTRAPAIHASRPATDDPLADREIVMSSDGETLHTGQTAADGTLFVKRGTLFGDNPPEGDSFTLTATFDADEDPHLAAVETTEEFTAGNGNGK